MTENTPTKWVLTLLTLLLILSTSYSASAKQLDAAVGWTKPPYIIAESNSGFELELVGKVMASIGHSIKPIYVPYGRSYRMLKNGQVDITLTLSEKAGIPENQLSDVYITYQNVVISLKENQLTINHLSDLQHYSVVAFQNARILLGSEYASNIERNSAYIELPIQRNQVEMLLQGNTEVVVMDINIFNHLSRELTGSSQMDNIDVHNLFPLNHYRVAFNDLQLRYEFNKALGSFLASEAYQELVSKYKLYPTSNYHQLTMVGS